MCKVRPHRNPAHFGLRTLQWPAEMTDNAFKDAPNLVIDAVLQSDRVVGIKLP